MSDSGTSKGKQIGLVTVKYKSTTQGNSSSSQPSSAATADVSKELGLPSRIASSARDLSRDVMRGNARVGAGSMTSLLSSTASSSQKGSPIASGSAHMAASAASALSEVRQRRDLSGSSRATMSDKKGKGKGRDTVSSGDEAFQMFAYPQDDLPEYSFSARTAIGQSCAANEGVLAVEREDGAAVVDLLNDTNNEMWHDPAVIDTDFNDRAEVSADDLFSGDSQLIQEVNAKIGEPPKHRTPSPTNSMNFGPQVEMLHLPTSVIPPTTNYQEESTSEIRARSMPYTLNIASSSKSSGTPVYFHSSHEQRAEWMGQWLKEWDSVLQRYADDVWGPDQIENIKEAKDALKELKSENDDSGWRLDDEKAVRRLKMVLGHIRLPAHPQE